MKTMKHMIESWNAIEKKLTHIFSFPPVIGFDVSRIQNYCIFAFLVINWSSKKPHNFFVECLWTAPLTARNINDLWVVVLFLAFSCNSTKIKQMNETFSLVKKRLNENHLLLKRRCKDSVCCCVDYFFYNFLFAFHYFYGNKINK